MLHRFFRRTSRVALLPASTSSLEAGLTASGGKFQALLLLLTPGDAFVCRGTELETP